MTKRQLIILLMQGDLDEDVVIECSTKLHIENLMPIHNAKLDRMDRIVLETEYNVQMIEVD